MFVRLVPFLITYANYFNSYEKASNDIRSQKRETKKFAEWLDLTEKQSKANGQLGLNDYLVCVSVCFVGNNLFTLQLYSSDYTSATRSKICSILEGTREQNRFYASRL